MVGVWSISLIIVLRCPTFLVLASLESRFALAFEIVNESLRNVIVLEKHHFLGLVCVGNLSLDKLRVCVASQLLSSNFSC